MRQLGSWEFGIRSSGEADRWDGFINYCFESAAWMLDSSILLSLSYNLHDPLVNFVVSYSRVRLEGAVPGKF